MDLTLRVEGLYIGDKDDTIEKSPQESLTFSFEGVEGDKHFGFTRGADSLNQEYECGSLMRSYRQWSAVSPEELELIAQKMGVPHIDPAWLGANLSLSGILNLTALPKGTKLYFPSGLVLVVYDANPPCVGPGKVIAGKYPEMRIKPNAFPKAAIGKRGTVGVVERPGIANVGEDVKVLLYKPKPYKKPRNKKR